MKILLDHNIPVQIASFLIGHEVRSTREMGWDLLMNGLLMKAAEAQGFVVMLTGDKTILKQYTRLTRRIAVVLVDNTDRVVLLAHVEAVLQALERASEGSFEVVPMPGTRDFLRR